MLHRVADRTLERDRIDLAFNEIIRGAGIERLEREIAVALTGEENDRRPAAEIQCLAQEDESIPAAEPVIEQAGVVVAAIQRGQTGLVIGRPFEGDFAPGNFREQLRRQQVVVGIVFD